MSVSWLEMAGTGELSPRDRARGIVVEASGSQLLCIRNERLDG